MCLLNVHIRSAVIWQNSFWGSYELQVKLEAREQEDNSNLEYYNNYYSRFTSYESVRTWKSSREEFLFRGYKVIKAK
jgi:hypothetical protein